MKKIITKLTIAKKIIHCLTFCDLCDNKFYQGGVLHETYIFIVAPNLLNYIQYHLKECSKHMAKSLLSENCFSRFVCTFTHQYSPNHTLTQNEESSKFRLIRRKEKITRQRALASCSLTFERLRCPLKILSAVVRW